MTRQERKTEITERFLAAADDGRQFEITRYSDLLRVHPLSGPPSPWMPTGGRLMAGGVYVNQLDDGRFELLTQPPTILNRV